MMKLFISSIIVIKETMNKKQFEYVKDLQKEIYTIIYTMYLMAKKKGRREWEPIEEVYKNYLSLFISYKTCVQQ